MTIGNDTYKIQKSLKINLFTPVRQLAESKLILAAPSSHAYVLGSSLHLGSG